MIKFKAPSLISFLLLVFQVIVAAPDGTMIPAKDFTILLTNAPNINSVEARKKSTCIVIAMQEKTKISELISSNTLAMAASGVLINTNPPLILTSKHTFCTKEGAPYYGIQLVKDPNKVKVAFNYYEGTSVVSGYKSNKFNWMHSLIVGSLTSMSENSSYKGEFSKIDMLAICKKV